jgi:hypothetical protein
MLNNFNTCSSVKLEASHKLSRLEFNTILTQTFGINPMCIYHQPNLHEKQKVKGLSHECDSVLSR